MKNKLRFCTNLVVTILFSILTVPCIAQSLDGYDLLDFNTNVYPVDHYEQFNGYTNHWHNTYMNWYRYGNLFKMSTPDIRNTILQSKVDAAEDIGIPGLLMQEGFISELSAHSYQILKYPDEAKLEASLKNEHVLAILDPTSELGARLEAKADPLFTWIKVINSHQYGAKNSALIKAFVLSKENRNLLVVSSSSKKQAYRFLEIILSTTSILEKYTLHKGWFGVGSLLKSVTCTPGHPLELIGIGMNEGCSWFVFDGYMDFLAQEELTNWVNEIDLPIVADVGFNPIYGCKNYEGLQVQDMATKESWYDYAHQRGGYVFKPVYSPDWEGFEFDGHIVHPGNKEQIDNGKWPFINKTGVLKDDLTSSMVLFIEKDKQLTQATIFDAIMKRKSVAIQDKALMIGPDNYRQALQLLYLDKQYLEDYYGDRINITARMEGYQLKVVLANKNAFSIKGKLHITTSDKLNIDNSQGLELAIPANSEKHLSFEVQPDRSALGSTNPIGINFSWDNQVKRTITMLDLPPVISAHQLLYGHAPEVKFPVTIHNYSRQNSFPVHIEVYEQGYNQAIFKDSKTCETTQSTFKDLNFNLKLKPGNYTVQVSALGANSSNQLGVGAAKGKAYLYEMDLNSDGVNEYRMENDSIQVTLLTTGARVIEFIVKSRNDNVLFKLWPKKAIDHKREFRKRGYYPYGGFEDFLGQASMETHKVYEAKIIKQEGDFVRVEMIADYYGNQLKKTFTLYGNSPLLEVRFALTFKNPEANVLGPQPILEIGEKHWTEDVFTVNTLDGYKEFRMRPENYYGQVIHLKEGWNAGYDSQEDITFIGAFPVKQPLFLHMWMNHPRNRDAHHYYMEFQPWTPIIQQSTMYFSYYLWGHGGHWKEGLDQMRSMNLITTR